MIGTLSFAARRRLQLGAAFLALFGGAVLLGWRSGAPAGTALPAARSAPWVLPQIVARDAARDAAILSARRPWGGASSFVDIDSPRPPPTVQPWQLAGVIERDNERLALVLIGRGPGAKLEYRAVGETLPDGSVLVQIGADSATSEGGQSAAAERRVHRLFDKAR